jgi:hypothetical protein
MESREDSEVDQIAGIDRVIYLKNNKSITIDEKVRYVNYPDILIEEYSDMDRGAMGWIEKPLTIDFVAYHIIPAKKIYLLDFRLLQRVWRKNKAKWKKLYQSKKAHNISSNGKEYCSLSWPIPIDELLVAMTMENIFTFSGENNIIT